MGQKEDKKNLPLTDKQISQFTLISKSELLIGGLITVALLLLGIGAALTFIFYKLLPATGNAWPQIAPGLYLGTAVIVAAIVIVYPASTAYAYWKSSKKLEQAINDRRLNLSPTDLLATSLSDASAAELLSALRKNSANNKASARSETIAAVVKDASDPADLRRTFLRALVGYGQSHFVELAGVIGALAISISLTLRITNTRPDIAEALQAIGLTGIGSSIVGAVSRSEILLKTFRNALVDVVYGTQHLPHRTDLKAIWLRVSEALSQQQFPKIANRVFEEMHGMYLKNHVPYFRKELVFNLDLEPAGNNSVTAIESACFALVPYASSAVVAYKQEVYIDDKTNALGLDTITKVLLDGELQNGAIKGYPVLAETKPGTWHEILSIELQGSDEYRLQIDASRTFDPRLDSYQLVTTDNVVETPFLKVSCRVPGLRVSFVPMGTPKDWRSSKYNHPVLPSDIDKVTDIDIHYPGVLLIGQGFMLIFSFDPDYLGAPTSVP